MKWNREKIEAQAQEARDGRGSAYVSLKKGTSVVGRPLPVSKPANDDDLSIDVVIHGQHFLKVTKPGGYYICLNEPEANDWLPASWGKRPCVLCARWKELRESRDLDEQDLAKDFNRSMKYLGNLAVKDEVKIHRYNTKSYPLLAGLLGGKNADCFEIKDGRDVEIKCIDDAGGYTLLPERESYSLRRDILDDLHDLYAELRILSPVLMIKMLKTGEKPDDADYVTLRDLMNEKAGKPAKSVSRDKGASAAEENDEPVKGRANDEPADGGGRPPTPREFKILTAFVKELDPEFDLDDEKSHADVVESLVTEALGTKVKSLSGDFLAWLEANGCAVDGRLVEKAPAEKPKVNAESDAVAKQIEEVRQRRKK